MAFKRNHAIVLGLVLVVIASVTVLISWSGDDRNIVRDLQEEPTLTVYVNETGQIQEMALEEYIQAVVAGEMFPDWPVEAYAAQAIFARSFTMDFIATGGVKDKYGADVSTSIQETQAFNPQAVTEEIKQGVEMTRGKVMTYENRFVRGWFHAYSGGITARAKEGLDYKDEEPPFTASVKLPDSESIPQDVKEWTATYNAGELRNLLASTGLNVGDIQSVEITEKGPSGRVTLFTVRGTQGEDTISGPSFRLAVDSTKMKSALLRDLVFEDGSLTMTGTGYGHGVGLSQWDAYVLADEGNSPEEIVKTFFQDVQIRTIYE
ncbi:MAG: SpoIID/LytB domain-containing protein [Limnochordia bacterium]|nr:SpoIID/LytB domain-containing protein [Limnochordia bacterium]